MHPKQIDIEAVFSAAQDCDETERERVVAELCGDNLELLSEVQSLLAAADMSQSFLEKPALIATDTARGSVPPLGEVFKPGSAFGSYQLLEEVGRGGMGVVFRAKRSDGEYNKEVAIKVLRRDFGVRNWAERFAVEKQILANLNHPNIAQLIDGGTTSDGQSYLVMEYVRGEPVDVYCERNNLSIIERLTLFKKICEAVNVAHSNLVVHRDLKPDNIIVDETGEPKLLDFGVAKLMSSNTDLTAGITNAVPFTPEYAAPEQLTGGNITTATDIYTLGKLLWELLSKSRPHSGITNIAELIRSITEEDVPDPSTHTTSELRSSLRGDLDAITRKALNRQPAERYPSVNHLITDIDNFLLNRPVVASHQGAFYRFGKFMKRHALAVFVATLFSLVLVAGAATSFWQWQIASNERDLSEQREDELRKVVRAMVFELPDKIINYPGSEGVRADMTERGVELLDLLHKQEPQDPTLLLDLAQAYFSMARLQRRPGHADLGQTELAIEHHNKSVTLLNRLLSVSAGDVEAKLMLAKNYTLLTYLYYSFNFQKQSGIESAKKCIQITKQWIDSKNPAFINARATCLLAASYIKFYDSHFEDIASHLTEAQALLDRVRVENITLPEGRDVILSTRLLEDRAKFASHKGNEQLAIDLDIKRLDIYTAMPEQHAKHKRRLIAWIHNLLGRRYVKIGEFEFAHTNLDQSLSSWSKIYERNARDTPAIQNLALVHTDKARLFWAQAEVEGVDALRVQACHQYTQSINMLNRLDEPLARFPTRHLGSPAPREIHAEAAQRCDN